MLNFIIFSKIYLLVNCPVGEPAVGELGVGELACWWTVLSVNRPSVSWVSVNCLSANRPGPVYIPLCPKQVDGRALTTKDWILDPIELESKFSSKTKLIIVNTPHNPLGKVWTLKWILCQGLKSILFYCRRRHRRTVYNVKN